MPKRPSGSLDIVLLAMLTGVVLLCSMWGWTGTRADDDSDDIIVAVADVNTPQIEAPSWQPVVGVAEASQQPAHLRIAAAIPLMLFCQTPGTPPVGTCRSNR